MVKITGWYDTPNGPEQPIYINADHVVAVYQCRKGHKGMFAPHTMVVMNNGLEFISPRSVNDIELLLRRT